MYNLSSSHTKTHSKSNIWGLILVLLALIFSGCEAYAAGSPTESPANPWTVGIVSDAQSAVCVPGYFPDPSSALQAAEIAMGTKVVFTDMGTFNGAPMYGFAMKYSGFAPAPNCNLVSSFRIMYVGNNYGKVCPNGVYLEAGAGACPPYAPPLKNCRDCSASAGDPIHLGTGNVFEDVTDYTTRGANPLAFVRYYNSLAASNTYAVSLGKNWRTNYDRYLNILSSTSVSVERADGIVLSFTYNGSAWVPDSDVDMTLTHTGSGTGSTWVLTDHRDTKETYTQLAGSEAQLNSIQQRNGYTQTLTYTSGKLTQVQDSFSRTLTLTYTGNLINTVTTPSGLVLTYGYNSSGVNPGVNDRLASVSYSTSPVTSLSYSYSSNTATPFALTGVTDENGNLYGSWTYDGYGRGLSSQHSGGADLTTVSYIDGFLNAYGTGPTATNALGQQQKYQFDWLQGAPKLVSISRPGTSTVPSAPAENFTYDTNGYLASRTDWNSVKTEYVNNAHGDPTTITDDGDSGTPARTTTITYDTTWPHLPASIVAPRKTTSFTYDTHGNVLTRTETDTTGGSTNGQSRTWTYTYDSLGHKLTETGPRTDVTATTTYTYTGNNLSTITDALSHLTQFTSYNNSGLPLSKTDASGVITDFTYDIRDRLLSNTVHTTLGNAITNVTYDNAGNVTKVTLPDNSFLSYTYDMAHRLTKVTDALGNYINYTLDGLGNPTATQTYDPANTLVKTQTAVFDSLGRPLQDITAAGQTTTYSYDGNGNRTYIKDNALNSMRYGYDAYNRVTSITSFIGYFSPISYDAQDNVKDANDPNGLGTHYTFNGFRELISRTSDAESGTTNYTRDNGGNVTSETDSRGVVTNRTFDKLNRVLTETYPASPSENITYTYDALGTYNKGVGKLTSFTDESGTTTYGYTERDTLFTDTRVVNGISYKISYAYTIGNRILSITYPSGHIVKFTRDAMGRITAISYTPATGQASVTLAGSIQYKPFGPVKGVTYHNGILGTRIFDQDYRLTGITASNSTQNLTIGYDNVSNVASITDSLNATRNQSFTYDKDYELLTASGAYGSLTYAYDKNKNRTSEVAGSVTSTYNYKNFHGNLPLINQIDNIVTGSITRLFSYGNDGNTLTDNRGGTGGVTFTYSNRDTLAQAVVSGGSTAVYKYNALGQRMLKTVGTVKTAFIYDQDGKLLGEYNGTTGAMIHEYVYLNDMPLVQIDPSDTFYYIHTDQLDTPIKITDASKAVVWDRVQAPFGKDYSLTGSLTHNLRFAGQYFDSETGLNYNWRRYYDSSLGRYIQADPIGQEGGFSPYAYAGQNPLGKIDPTGLVEEGVCHAAADEHCKEVRRQCISECTESKVPTRSYDGDPFFRCVADCMAAHGCGVGASNSAPNALDLLRAANALTGSLMHKMLHPPSH